MEMDGGAGSLPRISQLPWALLFALRLLPRDRGKGDDWGGSSPLQPAQLREPAGCLAARISEAVVLLLAGKGSGRDNCVS